ncbi:peptide-methionine (S)-S-oxide reductase MsrA [Phaeocystidibacter luteus]|nr:peptide-methionine (S)-S-oxide reductase MsrA [Phaeocystidibacter luteus]
MGRLSIVLSTLAMVLMACKSEPTQPIASTMNSEMSEETAVAIYASGCFWGTEYYMKRQEGVISTTVGYTGGHVDNPTYQEVCSKTTGHYEAVKVEYDPSIVSYEELTRLFFETHDPTQANGQGPDIGPQYRSAIFVANDSEREIAEDLIGILEAKGLDIATEVKDAATFWDAEGYHQDYYDNKGGTPYCHGYRKLF